MEGKQLSSPLQLTNCSEDQQQRDWASLSLDLLKISLGVLQGG